MRGRRTFFFLAALIGGPAACGDAASPPRPILDAPSVPALLASIAAGGVDLPQALAGCPATVQVDAK